MLKLAAAPPNFLPDITYFYKMSQCNTFVIADDIHFNTKTDITRTKIKSATGKQWLTVPVITKGMGKQTIKDVRISYNSDPGWAKRHLKTIQVNYNYSPYFEYYVDHFTQIYQKEWRFLLDFNLAFITLIREALRIETPIEFSSPLNSSVEKSEKIIEIVKYYKHTTYYTNVQDSVFLEAKKFDNANIGLAYFTNHPPIYRQLFGEYIEGLSILDLLFNEGPEAKWLLLEGNNLK